MTRRRSGARCALGLQGANFVVEWAPTATEGMERVAQWHPDVVLLDLSLPDMDGLDVCRELRTWTQVPIIVLSARAGEATRSRRWIWAPTTT